MNMLMKDYSRSVLSAVVFSLVLLVMVITVPGPANAMGSSGQEDRTFGNRGVVLFTDGGSANQTVIQPDGKLVSAVSSPERLIRHHSDGTLDTSFGNGAGFVAAPDKAVAILPDGKLVAADEVSVGFPRFAFRVKRFNSDGTIDSAFGVNGTAIAEFESTLEPASVHGYDVSASDVVVQDDGKILIVGTYNYYHYDGFTYSRRQIAQALARFNGDGSPDSGFGDFGKVVKDTNTALDPGDNPREAVNSVVLQPDGQIIVSGYLENDNFDMMVSRYNADGTPDTLFGFSGVASFDLGGVESGQDLTLQPDGDIVVVGRRELDGFLSADIALVRVHNSGVLDSGFGVDGATITDYEGHHDGANAVAIQQDGKIVISGFVTASGSKGSTDTVIGVARYHTNGTLDGGFGRNGIASTAIDNIIGERANDVFIQVDGKIVASGNAIIRYLP